MRKARTGQRLRGRIRPKEVIALVLCALGGAAGCTDSPTGVNLQPECIGNSTQPLLGTNLGGINLGGINLGGINLGGINLGGINLGGSNLGGINTAGSNLGGINTCGTNLGGNNLGGATLGATKLGEAILTGADLKGAALSQAIGDETIVDGTTPSGCPTATARKTSLSGSDEEGDFPGMGCPVNGTQNLGTDLISSTAGIDIHNLGPPKDGQMLYSGEDVFTRTSSCVVLGIGSTALAKLISQNGSDTTMYAAIKRLPWGFASTAGSPVALRAWEAVVWGSSRYAVFVIAAPEGTTYAVVAGFIKAVWRWAAPPTMTLSIGQIGGGEGEKDEDKLKVASHTGMMGTGAAFLAGDVTDKAYVAGELGLITATTNNESVMVDFASWVRKSDGTAQLLANVQTPNGPTHGEAVYRVLEETDGSARIVIGSIPHLGGLIDSIGELNVAYDGWQKGARPEKPVPLRCAGALFLNSINNSEADWEKKCDSGVAWSPVTAGTKGQATWGHIGGTVTPYNDNMTTQANNAEMYVTCRPNDIDNSTAPPTCPEKSLLPVISETFVHMWERAFTDSKVRPALQISVGGYSTCALRDDGTVWCFGSNGFGEIGSSPYGLQTFYPPTHVVELGNEVARVESGVFTPCAIKKDGTVWCWGLGHMGQLGNGSQTFIGTPAQIVGLTDVVQLAGVSFGFHACARKADGTAWCWGGNQFGQLGDGTTTQSSVPVEVSALGTNVAEISTGAHTTCARKIDGTLWCWGRNNVGQLGDGTQLDSFIPVQATALGNTVVDVEQSTRHFACARKLDGTLWCWGNNEYGELGAITPGPVSLEPVRVAGLTDVASFGLGSFHGCALKTDGTLWCWGRNDFGQLGDGTRTDRSTPLQVTALGADVAEVSVSNRQTCARMTNGTLRCWGFNGFGNLGSGTRAFSSPVRLASLGDQVAEGIVDATHGCARKKDGTVWCWGQFEFLGRGTSAIATPAPEQVPGLTNISQLAVAWYHSCGLKNDGTVWCWGHNETGMLGNGTFGWIAPVDATNPTPPTMVATQVLRDTGLPLEGIAQVAIGFSVSCARKIDGTVVCWGANNLGQLGIGSTDTFPYMFAQVPISGLTNVVQLSAGYNHICARKSDGTLRCWGGNADGQLGDGTTTNRNTPVQVAALGNNVVDVQHGEYHTCARKSDNSLWCWGRNSSSQLGDGTTTSSSTPVQVAALGNSVLSMALGEKHTCAVKTDFSLWCWGSNYNGQLGLGNKSPSLVTTPVKAADNMTQVTAGPNQTCAMKDKGKLYCWGDNMSGCLGVGLWADTAVPTVLFPW